MSEFDNGEWWHWEVTERVGNVPSSLQRVCNQCGTHLWVGDDGMLCSGPCGRYEDDAA